MLFPPQLGIKSHTKIFSCVGIWNILRNKTKILQVRGTITPMGRVRVIGEVLKV
jgi:hypothetical protein